ncbi:MAG: hypothetical protein GY854_16540 [Deltaproteobacteria bacterium]|nr:hypothetical protein [Deltaproteobacteria bacterium]
MTEKYEPAYVSDGRSVTTKRGIGHAGAKLSFRDLSAKNEQAQKMLFTKLLKEGYLEPEKTQADKFAESMSGQIGFGEGIGDEAPGDEVPEDEAPGDELPAGESLKRKSGAKRKK